MREIAEKIAERMANSVSIPEWAIKNCTDRFTDDILKAMQAERIHCAEQVEAMVAGDAARTGTLQYVARKLREDSL